MSLEGFFHIDSEVELLSSSVNGGWNTHGIAIVVTPSSLFLDIRRVFYLRNSKVT